uniref:Myelin protein zero like 3 n=1 Tax=Catharus ustulatus TaxID=91951 RepID=A0A8C3Y3P7_CATUS
KCSFKSSSPITENLLCFIATVIACPSLQVFHYQSIPYPTAAGRFKDRISWAGNVANGDASIAVQSPELSDNGTFICSVKNPPDVYHNLPQTVLLVTERGKAPCPHFDLSWTAPDILHLTPCVPWQEEMVFYYYSRHGVPVGRFKSRAQWQGDVSRRDGSIRLHDLRLNDSGTYECELRLLEDSSIFRSQTELLVSLEPRGACPEPAASPAAPGVPAVPCPASVTLLLLPSFEVCKHHSPGDDGEEQRQEQSRGES